MRPLEPISCPSCGAGVPLSLDGAAAVSCLHCGTEVQVPPDYVDATAALAAREEVRRRLEPQLARLSAAPAMVWSILAWVAVWLGPPVATAVDVWLETAPVDLAERLSRVAAPALVPGALLVFVLAVRGTTAMGVLEAMAARAPGEGQTAPGCRRCGAELRIRAEAMSASCGYCGVDSILSQVGLKQRANELREQRATDVTTLADAIARLRARRRLALVGAVVVLAPVVGLSWLLRWAAG